MVVISIIAVACMNILFLIIGLGILILKPMASCYSLLYGPLIALGGLLVVTSLLGLLGTCCRSPFFMWLYLLLKLILILTVAFGLLLDVAVMIKGGAAVNVERYRLSEYSRWVQDNVVGISTWPRVRLCLIHHNICSAHVTKLPPLFLSPTHSKLQGGCCQPPSECGFESINGTEWRIPETGRKMNSHQDCSVWKDEGDDQSNMCYDCEACKAGFLGDMTMVWRKLLPIVVVFHVILILFFIFGCHAFIHLKAHHYHKQYRSSTPATATTHNASFNI